ncbi:MAG: hypothetical protein PHG66_00700 [Candidatus Colwellbacteria bacterium]|nr:hypothetical protein [Candidatus Colwellbacteria bacterium]
MGQHPYECSLCGGGYTRCGKQPGQENEDGPCEVGCEGDQFCWEENVVAVILNGPKTGTWFKGKYKGYGEVHPADETDWRYIDGEFWADVDPKKSWAVQIFCSSCAEGKDLDTLALDTLKTAVVQPKAIIPMPPPRRLVPIVFEDEDDE